MFGQPKDIEGKCNAELHIGDDFGDNHATMKCQLLPNHPGYHREDYIRTRENKECRVTVVWEYDDRKDDTDTWFDREEE